MMRAGQSPASRPPAPGLAQLVVSAGHHQLQNVGRVLRKEALTIHSLNSMTLDADDVALARRWLQNRQAWSRRDEIDEYHFAFARWNGSKFACSFMAGRVALSAIVHALDLKPGDEVILPGYTCVVVPNALQYAGVKPTYVDIELDTFGLDAGRLEAAITRNTRAILIQHLYGLVCRDYEEILRIARRRDLFVIEDCAHATGAVYRGTKVGNLGDVAFYSSQNSKVFNTIQGGMAVTNDARLADRLLAFYDAAPPPAADLVEDQLHTLVHNYYSHKHPQRWWLADVARLWYRRRLVSHTTPEEKRGERPARYGCRMPAPIAALGLNQLRKIDRYNEQRRRTARRWDAWCESRGFRPATMIPESIPVYLRYPVMVTHAQKQDTSWARDALKVSVGVWFVSHIHPVDRWLDHCPNASEAARRCINLPTLL